MATAAAPSQPIKDTSPQAGKGGGKGSKLKESKSVGEFVKFYLVPIAMFSVSIIIIFFVIFPSVQGITRTLGEISTQKQEHARLSEIRTKRLALEAETSTQEADLATINALIPQSQTQVVDFSEKIRKTAETNRLEIKESLVGEEVTGGQAQNVQTSQNVKGLEMVELPAKFTVAGSFNNIRNFLTNIFGGDDFIIIKNMELRKQFGATVDPNGDQETFSRQNTDEWWMSITLVKYQFRVTADTTEADLDASYFLVPETARANPEVLKFINENYK